jgi:hypothetical protein
MQGERKVFKGVEKRRYREPFRREDFNNVHDLELVYSRDGM